MQMIIVEDRHYFRFSALSEILSDAFECDDDIEVLDIREAQRRVRFGVQCYDEIVILGALCFHRLKRLVRFLVRYKYGLKIRVLLFSDVVDLKVLEGPLLLRRNCALLSASIGQSELLSIIKGDTPIFNNSSVKFTRNDKCILERWSNMLSGTRVTNTMTKNDYQISRRLKLRMRINSEFSLYLLWRLSCNLSELKVM